jgi:hypothetical protein
MRFLYATVFFMAVLLTACSKPVEIDLPEMAPKLVINSFFKVGGKFEVHVSTTKDILSMDSTSLNNATVSLFANGVFQGNLIHADDGIYTHDTVIVRSGITYKVMVSAPGLESLEAEDTSPQSIFLESVYYDQRAYPDSEGGHYYKISLEFTDDPNTLNYYELVLLFYNNEDQYSVVRLWGDNEIVLLNEGDEEFYSGLCVFSDELFNGSPYNLRLKTTFGVTDMKKEMYLLTVSETFYKFRKSWIRHAHSQYPDITNPTEPVRLFSNVTGGYGIFAAYAESKIVTYE